MILLNISLFFSSIRVYGWALVSGEYFDQVNHHLSAPDHIFNRDPFIIAVHSTPINLGYNKWPESITGNTEIAEKVAVGKAGGNARYDVGAREMFRKGRFDGTIERAVGTAYSGRKPHYFLNVDIWIIDNECQFVDELLLVLVRQESAVEFDTRLCWHDVDFVAALKPGY